MVAEHCITIGEIEPMKVVVSEDRELMGERAADHAARLLRGAISEYGEANMIVATGASQFTVLERLVRAGNLDWACVTSFHLDEYIGLPISHPASFRGYLKERLVDLLPLRMFHYIDGEHEPPEDECARLSGLIANCRVDVALVGIGENGHLAFNDPPADFQTDSPYLVVDLDDACRGQQLAEGWFPSFDEVPQQAISMSVRQILKCRHIICSVPDQRKAEAVVNSIEGQVTPEVPASVLQQHADTTVYLDQAAASQLKNSYV